MAVDGAGYVYVVDQRNERVQKFTDTGDYVGEWGATGTDGKLTKPYGIAVDSSGNVYVSDRTDNRVVKYTSAGTYITTFGSPAYLDQPLGLDIRGSTVYIANAVKHNIQLWDTSGTYLDFWGAVGSE